MEKQFDKREFCRYDILIPSFSYIIAIILYSIIFLAIEESFKDHRKEYVFVEGRSNPPRFEILSKKTSKNLSLSVHNSYREIATWPDSVKSSSGEDRYGTRRAESKRRRRRRRRRRKSGKGCWGIRSPVFLYSQISGEEERAEWSGAGVIYAKSVMPVKRGPACTFSGSHLGVPSFLRGLGDRLTDLCARSPRA